MPEPAEVKARVLLIDDEPDVLKTVGRRLEQQGYAVLTAPDGFTGLKVARTEHPDVILLDIIMPHLDGHEVLQQLKRDPLTEDIPVLMLTAKIAERDMAESIKLGAVCHITKPYQSQELLEEVKLAVQRHRDKHTRRT